MSALEIVQTQLLNFGSYMGPVNATHGGTSVGDPSAGSGGTDSNNVALVDVTPATTGDKAGAAILTILIGSTVVGGALWMSY